MNPIGVSIILPVFNAERTLATTLESVLQQSFSKYELIAVDDGSTDKSLKILLDLADRDDRVRVISRANSGVASSRNMGAAMANGLLLAFLDADDVWHPDKLARHVQFHKPGQNVDISYARIAFVDGDHPTMLTPKTTSSIHHHPLTTAELIAENPACTMSNLVVRKRVFDRVGGFRDGMSYAEDQEWLVRAAAMGYAIKGIDDILVDYRLSPDGLSVNLDKMYDGWRAIAQDYHDQIDLPSAEAVYCRYLSRRALRAGASPKTAWYFAKRGMQLEPEAFLADRKRGAMTLLCALLARVLPRRARLFLFA